MKSQWWVVAVLSICGLGGCAESTLVRSSPPDAKVYQGDHFVGITPTRFTIPRDDLHDGIMLRVEREGYVTQEVAVPTHIAPGRIVGAIFTLGLTFLFKSPTTLADRIDVDLRPLPNAGGTNSATGGLRSATPAGAASSADAAASDGKTEDAEAQLKRLDDLLRKGLITDQEYRRYRADILKRL